MEVHPRIANLYSYLLSLVGSIWATSYLLHAIEEVRLETVKRRGEFGEDKKVQSHSEGVKKACNVLDTRWIYVTMGGKILDWLKIKMHQRSINL